MSLCDYIPADPQDKMDKVKVSSVRIAGHKIPYMVPHESEADEDEGTVSNHSSSRQVFTQIIQQERMKYEFVKKSNSYCLATSSYTS